MSAQTVIVTGASSGLGAAIAARFANDGARVIGTSRRATETSDFNATGLSMSRLDVCDDASVAAFRDRVLAAGAVPDVLVLNAGYGISGAIEITPPAAVTAQFDTNVVGTHRVIKAFLPAMRKRGAGKLIIIGSAAGRAAMPFQGFYSASKAALASYAESLSMELHPFGITVHLIEPGDHRTDFPDRRIMVDGGSESAYEPQQTRTLAAMIASERAGATPESLADVVAKFAAGKLRRSTYMKISRLEQVFIIMKAILPDSWFQAAVRRNFGMP